MRHYIGIVHKDEESAYGIHFPDVPGCYSGADDLNDLLANATEALSLYFEDQPYNAARTLDELRYDEDVRDHLTDGGFLLAVPVVELTGRQKTANISMDAGILQAIDNTAKARGMTRSAFLVELARKEIAKG